MNKKEINIKGFEGLYYIYEDGSCYSIRKQRYLKPNVNNVGYVQYFLTPEAGAKFGKWMKAHRLVLITFRGYDPDPNKKEVNHIDHNKHNNHISNLEWVTHSQNVLKSFQEGYREAYWKNRKKQPFSLETRLKMSDAKKKPILATHKQTMKQTIFDSIGDASEHFNVDRKTINRYISNESNHKEYIFEFKPDFI